jgi:peptidoglycan hydrolase-like protein with peptidoglycan-binding domain
VREVRRPEVQREQGGRQVRTALLRRSSAEAEELALPGRDGDGPERSRRRGRVLVALALAAVAAVAVVLVALSGGSERGGRRQAGGGVNAVPVSRQTLIQRETVDGTLGYAGASTVVNRLASDGGGSDPNASGGSDPSANSPRGSGAPNGGNGSGDGGSGSGSGDTGTTSSGTVTALARSGSVVTRGGVLFRIDTQPIILMYGSMPAYRDLDVDATDGQDVLQLEENLALLGFDPGVVDDTFTTSTTAAVRDWQDSVGLTETGTVELGRVVFLPGARRIGQHNASVGAVPGTGGEVLETSSTKRVVKVELDVTLQNLARKGARVEITLAEGATVRGRIVRVGRVAREQSSSDGDPNAAPQLVIDMTIELRSSRRLGRLDEAPVGVGLARQSRRNVLAVPVEALLARRGGGYGVELAGSRRVVPVRAGMFADGYVEVSGAGIREGTRVVAPNV